MQIFINDTPTTCGENSSLQEVLAENNISPVNIAIAISDTVIPKTQWAATCMQDGCHIIVIKAVQGG